MSYKCTNFDEGTIYAGILLSSLGAVMDTTISVASALHEVRMQKHKMSIVDVFSSGAANF